MPAIPSILILHGNDEFAIAGHIEKLCAGLGDPSTADMNIARFDGRLGLDFEAFNTSVNAAPFLAPRRVVVLVHPVSAFGSQATLKKSVELRDKAQPETTGALAGDDELKSDHRLFTRKKFLELLDKAQPTTAIVLAEYTELKRDHWLLKWAASHIPSGNRETLAGTGSLAVPPVGVHLYNLPKRLEMPRWIESETKKLGGKIEPGAAARLSEMVGEDPRIAAQELTKLLTYVNFARPVNMLDVEQVSIASAQGNIFELVDALGLGDGKKAQHVLHQLLEEAEAFALWGMVIRQFRLLLQARELLDAGESIPQIQKELGLHEFVAQKVTHQAKRFSLPALEVIYHKLLEIDEGVKTSQVPLDLALDLLVVDLAKK
ncbi:MAG TPA: DNA polymerase III subunit delta [Anaerolineales bacterium]